LRSTWAKAEDRHQRQVLLQREPGLHGEILAGHEEATGALLPVPDQAAGAVQQGLVQALAALT